MVYKVWHFIFSCIVKIYYICNIIKNQIMQNQQLLFESYIDSMSAALQLDADNPHLDTNVQASLHTLNEQYNDSFEFTDELRIQTGLELIDNKYFIPREQLINEFNIPQGTKAEGCYLVASEESEQLIKRQQFIRYMSMWGIDFSSAKTFSKIWSYLVESNHPIINNFDLALSQEHLSSELLYNAGLGRRQIQIFNRNFFERLKRDGIPMHKLIQTRLIDGCGRTISKEYAKKLCDRPYSFDGLNSKILKELSTFDSYIDNLTLTLERNGYTIVMPEDDVQVDTSSMLKYVLTGSPKSFGYKTKAMFKDELSNSIEVKKLKEADVLITDDLSSNSSKMKLAKSLNVEIITYADAIFRQQ